MARTTAKEETTEQTPSEVQPKSQIEDVTFVEPTVEDTHDSKKVEFEDTDENNDILEEDKKMKDQLTDGDLKPSLVSKASDLAVLQVAMVPHPLSGKPVYATAHQSELAQSVKGEL